ncbi:MAG TPA: hypothetical protein VGN47_16295 [Blastococcus sp.]|nr:hypothetical protein [Blastococcus sp.]
MIVAVLVAPILLFLVVAVCPALLGQGTAWFSLDGFATALSGTFLQGLLDSVMVAVVAGLTATALGGLVAWAVLRTDVPGRALWSGGMFAVLLAPSYLIALGWERLLEPSGVLDVLGLPAAGLRSVFYGPVGVTLVLTMKGLPFAYLAVSGALRGLGEEFESAVRVHGGGRRDAARIVTALVAPACWSAFAIVFAESISDFGVAATLANDAHFPVAIYTLYTAIYSFPVRFDVAAAVGWVLMALAGLALLAQGRALRGRSYQVISGRSRTVRRHRLSMAGRSGLAGGMAILLVIALGVPVLGAVSASLISGLGSLAANHGLTLDNYRRVLASPALHQPLLFSAEMALGTATATVVMAAVAARLLSRGGTRLSGRMLDLLLLTAVALPGIVFAAGYIFTYNLPQVNRLGIHLYQTSALLFLGYLATALPSTTRVLVGSVVQVRDSLRDAGRVHGAGPVSAWLRTVLPILARPLLAAWALTFAGTLLELPVSQLLYPPGRPPVAVGITKALANYDFGGGTAMEVIAILLALAVVSASWGLFRLLAPAGVRRLGRAE